MFSIEGIGNLQTYFRFLEKEPEEGLTSQKSIEIEESPIFIHSILTQMYQISLVLEAFQMEKPCWTFLGVIFPLICKQVYTYPQSHQHMSHMCEIMVQSEGISDSRKQYKNLQILTKWSRARVRWSRNHENRKNKATLNNFKTFIEITANNIRNETSSCSYWSFSFIWFSDLKWKSYLCNS